MVEQLKKPTLFKSKSLSLIVTDGCLNKRKQMKESHLMLHSSPEEMKLQAHDDDKCNYRTYLTSPKDQMKGSNIPAKEKTSYYSQSPTSTRLPLKILRSVYSCDEEDDCKKDNIQTVRVPLKRRRSFMPATAYSRSTFHSNGNTSSADERTFNLVCPVFERDGENCNENIETDKLHVPARRRGSFLPTALRGISLSPKPGFKKTSISSQIQVAKPPLLRTLSYSASTDTCNTETDYSDLTRSTTGSPTSSSSDSQQQIDEPPVATNSLKEASNNNIFFFDLDKSSRSTFSTRNVCDDGGRLKERQETKMSFVRSLSLVVVMFVWHYMKVIGLTFNLRTIFAKIWMTLFDIVVEAVALVVELTSYAIPIILRLFETSMLWFVQQVYIRRIFIYLYNTFKNRKKVDAAVVDVDETSSNEVTSNPTEKCNRRPIRFLYVSKDTARRRNIRVGSYKD